MNYTDEILAEAIDALTDDGDTFELPDGATLVLRIQPDECSTIEDIGGDWYGAIEWEDTRRTNSYGHVMRPDGFDGNAEKLSTRDGSIWWQPPTDVKRGTDTFDAMRRNLIDLIEYGYSSVGVEYHKGTDAYGRPIVRGCSWLGGFEPFEDVADALELSDLVLDAIDQAEDSEPITAP